ncbi:citrate lyase holo-[acyl-carrier protein] synthase [Bacillus sp. ISL-7]|uniref:citrate lyase holo-[acyl-carrier protein] synthase n=1 Tax=Bacillus sp. ISL-7 TaxID=2819136 RepID=UPI001BE8D589|nr:citrate lyase holo-[acyl-carrier protein] synthase [Bacillus sp. ISL-7]MBT2733249.1 citrate lyase holo-[acyl-carrier protein] synthase [Bacillus sp. ISL-7]
MTRGKEITLEQILEAREYRAAHQKELIEKYRLPLVSLTVNIPGPVKKTPESSIIFLEGCNALVKKLKKAAIYLEYFETNRPITGYEAYFVVKTDERTLKVYMLEIENEHPLGRLFDLDVIGSDGVPISREDFGHLKRKCLLCDEDAHSCGRSRKHTIEAVTQKIQSMVDSYL